MSTNITFGVYTAIAHIVLLLIKHFTGLDVSKAGLWYDWLGLVPTIVFIVLAVKERRDEEFAGVIRYGQCVGTGSMVTLFSSLITSIYFYVHYSFIAPDAIAFMIQQKQEMIATWMKGQSAADIARATDSAGAYTTPLWMAIGGFVFLLLIGVVVSLIAGAFQKSSDEKFNAVA